MNNESKIQVLFQHNDKSTSVSEFVTVETEMRFITKKIKDHLKEQKLQDVTIQKVLGWKSLTGSKITIY